MNNLFRKTDSSYPDPILTENAETVLRDRYLEKNENGENVEDSKDMFYRVAAATASAEKNQKEKTKWTRTFYDLMSTGLFMPNSPTLMNAGRNNNLLSACFVLPIEDSIDGIFDTVKDTAIIQKAGGGTGFSFDRLRPTGDYIKSSGGNTSGPISFWKVLSEATNAIQQGAFRRGANMGMMSITHPDIIKFIHAKQDLSAFTNYNISIKVSEKWMKSFEEDPEGLHIVENFRNGKKYLIPREFTGNSPGNQPANKMNYGIQNLVPYEDQKDEGTFYKDKFWTKKEIFDVIVDCAWKTGEPGLIFIDEINAKNPTPHVGEIEATNPCGEQPLLPYEACNLGSIDVSKFIRNGELDKKTLRQVVRESVRFLDNIIEINPYPIKQIDEICKNNRKIGLGLMGFADALFMLGVPYNSDEAVNFGRDLMKLINDEAHRYSGVLAKERGNFANYKGSIYDGVKPMRNSTTTTVAPTGTISIIADCSGGIEPMFSLSFKRQVLNGKTLYEVNKHFKKVAQERGFYSQEIMERVFKEGTLAHIEEIPEDIKKIYVCTHDISPEWHVKMQAAFQEHCDSSISKTINFPESATREHVLSTYLQAWKSKCKGITVYRDNCRAFQPMALDDKETVEVTEEKERKEKNFVVRSPRKTPSIVSSVRVRQSTPFGHMHVNVSVDPSTNKEIEVFAQLGKAGDVLASDLEALCRLTSLYLRLGGSLADIVNQLEGIGSTTIIPTRDGNISSMADALSKALSKFRNAKSKGLKELLLGQLSQEQLYKKTTIPVTKEKIEADKPALSTGKSIFQKKEKCPDCGADLIPTSKCWECSARCGYSKC